MKTSTVEGENAMENHAIFDLTSLECSFGVVQKNDGFRDFGAIYRLTATQNLRVQPTLMMVVWGEGGNSIEIFFFIIREYKHTGGGTIHRGVVVGQGIFPESKKINDMKSVVGIWEIGSKN